MKKQISFHEQQLKTILAQVEVKDAQTYLVKGHERKVYHSQSYVQYHAALDHFGSNQIQDHAAQKEKMIQYLCGTLYSQFYCGIVQEAAMPPKAERAAFMNQLSAANKSTQEPDPNWRIYAVSNGAAFAQKNGQVRPVEANTYVPLANDAALLVNQHIQFYRQKENRGVQNVFYYVYGNEYLTPDCEMLRIYWNIAPEAAPMLVEQVTTVLNDYRIPFHFKCLNHPDLYNRNDSAVLYFDKIQLAVVRLLLPEIIENVRPYLRDASPYFSDRIDTGVSLAEDPGGGQSFGMHRCKLIATALYEMYEKRIAKRSRFTFLKKYLQKAGVKPTQMSINPHTKHFLLVA